MNDFHNTVIERLQQQNEDLKLQLEQMRASRDWWSNRAAENKRELELERACRPDLGRLWARKRFSVPEKAKDGKIKSVV